MRSAILARLLRDIKKIECRQKMFRKINNTLLQTGFLVAKMSLLLALMFLM